MLNLFIILICQVLSLDVPLVMYPDDTPADGEPLDNLHIKRGGPPPENLHRAGPATIFVSFTAYNNEYELSLKIRRNMFHEKAAKDIQRHWTYYGNVTLNGWLTGRASLTFHQDDYHSTFKGTMKVDDVHYRLHHATFYENLRGKSFAMGMHRFGDGIYNDPTKPEDYDTLLHDHPEVQRRRLQMVYFDNCWTGQETYVKSVDAGYVIDQQFVDRVLTYMAQVPNVADRDKVMIYMHQMHEDTVDLYHSQVDIWISMREVIFPGDMTMTPDIHQQLRVCPNNAEQIDNARESLNALRAWRAANRNVPDGPAFFKLLTNCYSSGIVGYAGVNVLCRSTGAGFSNFLPENQIGTWSTNAHEIGHIFGCGHSFEDGQGTTGGIMDYGDGLYQQILQFNPYRKTQICGTISGRMQDSAWCFSTFGQDDGVTFAWRKNGALSACWPANFGTYRWKSTQFDCEVYQDGVKAINPTYTCDISDRPHGEIWTCDAIPPSSNCGNGVIEEDEECEASLDGTCCVACSWNVTADGCAGADNIFDATFMTGSQVQYGIRKGMVYRYSGGMENGLDGGYPKAIQDAWPNVESSIASGVTAAMFQAPNLVWLLNNRDYQVINYDTGADVNGGVQSWSQGDVTKSNGGSSAIWNDDAYWREPISSNSRVFWNCGKITAALGFSETYWLFCDTMYAILWWNKTLSSLRSVDELNLAFDWDTTLQHNVDSAYYDSTAQKVRFFNAGYRVDWWAYRSLTTQQPSFSLMTTGASGGGGGGGEAAQSCAEHCTSCRTGLPDQCTSCESGYRLWGTRCISELLRFVMNFDTDADSEDYLLFARGQLQMLEYTSNNKIQPGDLNGNMFLIEPTDRIDFIPVDQDFVDFTFTAHFKPLSTHEYTQDIKFVTFTDGREDRISIDFKQDSIALERMNMDVQFRTYATSCQPQGKLNFDAWNQIEVEFKRYSLRCCLNANCLEQAYMSDDNYKFRMQDWYVGSNSNGLKGEIDSLTLTIGQLPQAPPPVDKLLVSVVVILLIFGIVAALGTKYRSQMLDPCGGQDRSVSKPPEVEKQSAVSPWTPPTAPARQDSRKEGQIGSTSPAPPPVPGAYGGKQLPDSPSPARPASGPGAPRPPPARPGPPKPPGKLGANRFKFGQNKSVQKPGRLPPPPKKSLYS